MHKAGVSAINFARDLKELKTLGFVKVIDGEVFVNPRMCWAGSERLRQYRIKCWDANVSEIVSEALFMLTEDEELASTGEEFSIVNY